MGSGAESPGDELRVVDEVDASDVVERWEPGSLDEIEIEAVAESSLTTPGGARSRHAPVDEDDPGRSFDHVTNVLVFG